MLNGRSISSGRLVSLLLPAALVCIVAVGIFMIWVSRRDRSSVVVATT
jgi:hypothetical protein